MKHGDVVGKDAYGRKVRVGDLVDITEWYGLELTIYRNIVIGLTNGGNYRTCLVWKNKDNTFGGWIAWRYPKQPVLAVTETLDPTHYDWVNEYLVKGQPDYMFDDMIMEWLSDKERRQYKLEVTNE